MIRRLRHWRDRRRRPAVYARLATLLPVLDQDPEQVRGRQRHDLEAIVRFAACNTDFYRDRLGPWLPPPGGPFDITTLPVLEKQDVVENRDAMLVRGVDPGRVRLGHTGGSTGRPLAFYYDDAKHALMLAGMMRGFMLSGWRPGQRVLYLWGASRDVASGGVFARGAGSLFDTERSLAAVEYSEANLERWAGMVREWRPSLLYGYASALGELARFVVERGLRMPRTLRGAYSTAELLQDPQRELMERAFGCRVFNQYGCREVPNIAWECRHGNMHVFSDMVHVESVAADGEARLLVTSLTDRVMPFIRYALGDTGHLLDCACSCGLPFPLLEMDLCRHNDLIRTADGRRVHPAYFNRLLYGLTQVRQYQWVQTGPDRLQLNLVSREPLGEPVLQSLSESIRREVDAVMTLEVNYLDEIPRTASGKHRFVIGLTSDAQ